MLQWLEFIGEAILSIFTGIPQLFGILVDAWGIARISFLSAPGFLQPILYLTLAVAVIMWVVNLI